MAIRPEQGAERPGDRSRVRVRAGDRQRDHAKLSFRQDHLSGFIPPRALALLERHELRLRGVVALARRRL